MRGDDTTMPEESLTEPQRVNRELGMLIEERDAELLQANTLLQAEKFSREQLEDALRFFKERYIFLEENISEVIFSLDSEGHIIYVSPSVESRLGYKMNEIKGKYYMGFIHHDDLPGLAASFEHAMSGQKEQCEFRVFQNDGSVCYVRAHARWVEENGHLKLDGCLTDITSLRKAEESLKWFVEKYRYLLKISPREMALLSEMSESLNSCWNMDEAYEICARFMQELFPPTSGALCLINEEGNLVEAMKIWGEPQYTQKVFSPNDCWSLRRNQQNLLDDPRMGLLCGHITKPQTDCLCTPLVTQKKTLGILYLQENIDKSNSKQYFDKHIQQLALAAADHLALALSSLSIREALRQKSIRDTLTGLFSQCYMVETLEREIYRAKKKRSPAGRDHVQNSPF